MNRFRKSIVCAALLILPFAALADVTPPAPGSTAGGLGEAAAKAESAGSIAYGPEATQRSLEQIVGSVIQSVLALIGILFLVLAIYGGYTWMMARGNEQEVEKGRDIIKAAVIGVAIILAAYAITSFVINRLVTATTGVQVGS